MGEKKQKKASKDEDGTKQELKIEPVDEFDAMITDNKDSNQKLADRIEKKKKSKGNEILEKELKTESIEEQEKFTERSEEPTTSDRFAKYDLQFCTSPKESKKKKEKQTEKEKKKTGAKSVPKPLSNDDHDD